MNGDHANERGDTPRLLGQLWDRFEHWRRQNGPGSRRRIPPDLWEEASVLASQHGVLKVAQMLRLDYSALKKQAGVPLPRPPQPSSSPFVEWVLPDSRARGENLIEFFNREAARMTLRSQAAGGQSLLELVEVFLRPRK